MALNSQFYLEEFILNFTFMSQDASSVRLTLWRNPRVTSWLQQVRPNVRLEILINLVLLLYVLSGTKH